MGMDNHIVQTITKGPAEAIIVLLRQDYDLNTIIDYEQSEMPVVQIPASSSHIVTQKTS